MSNDIRPPAPISASLISGCDGAGGGAWRGGVVVNSDWRGRVVEGFDWPEVVVDGGARSRPTKYVPYGNAGTAPARYTSSVKG